MSEVIVTSVTTCGVTRRAADHRIIRLRRHAPSTKAVAAVFENEDLLGLILQHSVTTPRDFVMVSRVGRVWHATCMRDAHLALQAAKMVRHLSKCALMGLLGLSNEEADAMPRSVVDRRGGGFMYSYDASTVEQAWESVVGGVTGWRARLDARSVQQRSIEQAFGVHWRRLQWLKA